MLLREATEFTSGAGYLRGVVSFHPLTEGPTIFSPLAKGVATFFQFENVWKRATYNFSPPAVYRELP